MSESEREREQERERLFRETFGVIVSTYCVAPASLSIPKICVLCNVWGSYVIRVLMELMPQILYYYLLSFIQGCTPMIVFAFIANETQNEICVGGGRTKEIPYKKGD